MTTQQYVTVTVGPGDRAAAAAVSLRLARYSVTLQSCRGRGITRGPSPGPSHESTGIIISDGPARAASSISSTRIPGRVRRAWLRLLP